MLAGVGFAAQQIRWVWSKTLQLGPSEEVIGPRPCRRTDSPVIAQAIVNSNHTSQHQSIGIERTAAGRRDPTNTAEIAAARSDGQARKSGGTLGQLIRFLPLLAFEYRLDLRCNPAPGDLGEKGERADYGAKETRGEDQQNEDTRKNEIPRAPPPPEQRGAQGNRAASTRQTP